MTKENKMIDFKDMQSNATEKARQVWLAGLGALATVEEEGNKLYESLVTKGVDFEKRGKDQIDSLIESVTGTVKENQSKVSSTVSSTFDDTVKQVLDRFDIPSRDEIKSLIKKVDTLAKKVDDLAKKADKPAAKPQSAAK